jgi:hypothetical protein
MWNRAILGRTPSSGEGMQRDTNFNRGLGGAVFARAGIARAVLAAVLMAVATCAGGSRALAQTYGSDSGNVWDKMLDTVGMGKSNPDADINYTERPPLVVPPTRDLPPPAAGAAAVPDWPTNPVKRSSKSSKNKEVVVPNTAVQTPNPVIQKKPWYNPMGWFDKEEYANFAGEPVRKNLTDPPAGYRVPSPDQPYGIGPDKKPGKAQASSTDFALGSALPSSGGGQ